MTNLTNKNSNTLEYAHEYLLDCETHQMDMVTSLGDVEVVDVLGAVEDNGHVYIGLEVEYNEYCYLLHIDFNNSWDFVYKDEMIEIQDKINSLIAEKLIIEMGK